MKRYNEAVAEASRLDEILSSAQQSYADKKVTDSINALKVEYIDVKLGDYVKTATYQVGVNGINSMISAIKNNPSANIVGWGDLANKTYVQSAINATASEIGASVREYIDGTTYKETIVKMTQDSINQTISRVTQGKVTSINQLSYTVNGMQNLISNPDGIANQVLASNLFKTEISNSVGSSIQTQMADYWSAQIKNSGGDIITAINATTGGVQIKGDLIRLTGTTVMDDAFANKLLTNTVSTTTVSAFTGIFSTLIAQNLDINNISGNHGEFISLGLKARYSYMNLTGNGLEIGDYAGEWLAKHDRQGIKFFNQGKHTATIQNVEDVAGMFESVTTLVAEGWYNGAVALSYRKRVGENSSRVLWVSGSEGKLNTSGLLYYNDTQYGIQYYKNTITDTGEGVLITSTHDTSAAICFVNGKVWYKTSAHGWRDLDRLALAY